MRVVVANLKNQAASKPATKILLALCLAEANRRVAVEAGAVGTFVEVATELEEAAAERALAALELTCTVPEGAAELRAHALAVPVMVSMMGKMAGRGREYAISALTIIYGNCGSGEQVQHAPPEEVARAVVLALQGDCPDRGKRKGSQLLKALQEYGRLDLSHEGNVRF
uniref:U-box domain-containing protein n=1 Tax=Rhizophora mucronata TaxID=61149 RepID=A0A2P2P215_RHIMU